jgi:GT2 family glycosyltransferase/lipopolysaccharide/colanic/teichoic acid biosynthesis glycosyltransferase
MQESTELSIIIVSYNVRAFLLHCLESVHRATENIRAEIYVVDNASADGSVQAIKSHFPDVKLIKNDKNLGFAAANNLALKKTSGKYVLFLNPDTVVQEDTFSSLLNFMGNNPQAGAVTCKILNPDGSFSVDSRHSIPSPLTAFWKLIGLNRIFPKSKIFGRYNLTYLDPDEINSVDAISGSIMFIRKDTIDDVGPLDESFFMYCEDIDYCYRITQAGWQIYYFPETQIIHYKGESTKRSDLDYVINFNKSLYLFYKKHFQHRYVRVFSLGILAGVFIRGITIFLKNIMRKHSAALFDLFLLNTIILSGFYIRYQSISSFGWDDYINQYVWINIIASFLFILTAFFLELYEKYRFSIVQVIKVNLITFLILSALTFFVRQLPYSRTIVIAAAFFGSLLMIGWRAILRMIYSPQGKTFSKSLFQRKSVLIGNNNQIRDVLYKLRQHVLLNLDIRGILSIDSPHENIEIEGFPQVSSVSDLEEYIRVEHIDQLIFTSHEIPFKTIMQIITQSRTTRVDFKMIPEQLDVIIGKSSVEDLEAYPLLDLDYKLGRPFNRFTKRLFDMVGASSILFITFPIWISNLIFRRHNTILIWDEDGLERKIIQFGNTDPRGFLNQLLLIGYVLVGALSFVGAPLARIETGKPTYLYRPGLTGLVQLNSNKIQQTEDREIYELYYLKNQSIWLDLEIILKTIQPSWL